MYKKKLQVETAGIGGALGPAGGALEEGATRQKPVEGAIGGGLGAIGGSALGSAAGTAAGGLATGLTGGLAAPLVPLATGAGGLLGGAVGSSVGGEVLGGQKKREFLQAATSDEMPSDDPIEKFLNKHSSTGEAIQEFQEKPVLPTAIDGNATGKLVTSTACNTGKV